MLTTYTFDGGKYQIIRDDETRSVTAKRHGEDWIAGSAQFLGNKLLHAMLDACDNMPGLLAELSALLPGTYYMDPPDGGDGSLLEQLRRMSEDSARYRKLRNEHWSNGRVAVVANPKEVVRLGSYCPSGERLDQFIDTFVPSAPPQALPAVKPRPMSTAPRDGTVVMVYAEGNDYPYPMQWKAPWPNEDHADTDTMEPSWRLTWDDTQFLEYELLGWLPVQTYSGEAVK